MLKPFLILSALVLYGVSAPPPQAPQQPAAAPAAAAAAPAAADGKIPLEAVNRVNPVKPSAESLSRAKKVYGYECAACHGDNGGGDGDVAKDMKSKIADFRDPTSLKSLTDAELFYIIEKGKGEMEGEGARLKPDDTWNIVNYIRSMAKGQATATAQGPA
jgi:mono/diheme cytochrome c family protein